MTKSDIIKILLKLSIAERLSITETLLQTIREEIQLNKQITPQKIDKKEQLREAARILMADYSEDKELTAFVSLDSENFYV